MSKQAERGLPITSSPIKCKHINHCYCPRYGLVHLAYYATVYVIPRQRYVLLLMTMCTAFISVITVSAFSDWSQTTEKKTAGVTKNIDKTKLFVRYRLLRYKSFRRPSGGLEAEKFTHEAEYRICQV